jgi:hypothetical protein
MKKPNHSASKSTSRIPPATIELEELNELQTFTSGRIGPWTERAVAMLRTLVSASAACDGLSCMPKDLADGVLEREMTMYIRQAVKCAEEHVVCLVRFEKADDPSGWEEETPGVDG